MDQQPESENLLEVSDRLIFNLYAVFECENFQAMDTDGVLPPTSRNTVEQHIESVNIDILINFEFCLQCEIFSY